MTGEASKMNAAAGVERPEPIPRPIWLRVPIAILCAYQSFILSMSALGLLFVRVNRAMSRPIRRFDREAQDILVIPGLLLMLLISIAVAIAATRWQSRFLDKKPLWISYLVLVVLVILALTIIPFPYVNLEEPGGSPK